MKPEGISNCDKHGKANELAKGNHQPMMAMHTAFVFFIPSRVALGAYQPMDLPA